MVRKLLLCSADRAERGLLDPVMVELKRRVDVQAEWCELDSHSNPYQIINDFAVRLLKMHASPPDIIVVPTDRNEMVYVAAYAFHKGYIVAHFHAGNSPANHPDDINRRAISCFSHIILCNMKEHKENLIRQGEEEWRIHVVGSTAFDNIEYDDSLTPKEPFDLVILHPNPTSEGKTLSDLEHTFSRTKHSKKVIWIYPNHDKNHEVIEAFLDNNDHQFIVDGVSPVVLAHYRAILKYKNLPRSQFLSLLKNCARAIGNSSSFYYELPVVNPKAKIIQIGERNKSLIVPPTKTGGARRIADILATITIDDNLRNKRLTL